MRARWQALMLSDDGVVSTLGEVIDALDERGRSAFVRPDADDKQFDGAVYDADELRAASRPCDRGLAVIRATPRVIDAEWRCFVVGGEVVVHHQIPEIERRLVHARILPVEEPDPRTIAQEVGAEQIVVARHEFIGRGGEGT